MIQDEVPMAYDFQHLQTIHCFDAITIRVPARWDCGPDWELRGSWCCCKDGEESGTLWITLDRFQGPGNADGASGFDLRGFVDAMVDDIMSENSDPTLENDIVDIEGGYLWKRIFDGVEEGENLRYFRYKFFKCRENEVAIADFNFVLLASDLGDPEFLDLIQIMDREIRAARVEP